MKQLKTAEEFLREAHRKLSEPNPADWNQFDEIMKDEQGPAMIEAMKAYAEQFIDNAADSIYAGPDDVNRKIVLKLKEQLK